MIVFNTTSEDQQVFARVKSNDANNFILFIETPIIEDYTFVLKNSSDESITLVQGGVIFQKHAIFLLHDFNFLFAPFLQ